MVNFGLVPDFWRGLSDNDNGAILKFVGTNGDLQQDVIGQ
jgi:hypothetical protein